MPDTSGFYNVCQVNQRVERDDSIMSSPRKSHNNLGKVSGSVTENHPSLFQSNFSHLHQSRREESTNAQYNPGALNSSTLTRLRFISEKSFIMVNVR